MTHENSRRPTIIYLTAAKLPLPTIANPTPAYLSATG